MSLNEYYVTRGMQYVFFKGEMCVYDVNAKCALISDVHVKFESIIANLRYARGPRAAGYAGVWLARQERIF